jgi:hypothetical protein
MKRRTLWLTIFAISMIVWASALAWVFTGHSKLLWVAQTSVHAVKHGAFKARRAEHKLLGDHEDQQ